MTSWSLRGRSCRLFVCYRRRDDPGRARLLYEELADRFDTFFDREDIPPGVEFPVHIEQRIASSDALIVVIGENWLRLTDPAGRPQIRSRGDHVRREIEVALRHGVQILPVLLPDGRMPSRDALPRSIRALAGRNASELSDAHWPRDVKLLIDQLQEICPTNRFASYRRIVNVAPLRALLVNALTRPLNVAIAVLIAGAALVTRPWVFAVALGAYVALAATTFFDLNQARALERRRPADDGPALF